MPAPLNIIWQRDLTLNRYWTSVAPEATFTPVMPREYGWICDLLQGFDVCHYRDGRYEIVATNPIVVLEGQEYNPSQVQAYLRRLRALGNQVGIIHIGDEFGWAPLEVYDQAAFVYRNYWRPEISEIEHCHYLPLGVNCSLDLFQRSSFSQRPYKWSFAGQVKPSRQAMLDAVSGRTNGRLVVNEHFNSGLSKTAYADLLSQTQVVLCPRGWASVESYRLYEALEAGAIPLVEDDGGPGLFREHATSSAGWNAVLGGPKYWYDVARRAHQPSYWQSAFGDDFPCPRIYKWENLDSVVDALALAPLSARIRDWWSRHKRQLRLDLSAAVRRSLHATASDVEAVPT